MIKRTNPKIWRAVVFLFVVSPWACQSAYGQPWDGNGVEGDPYQIWTAADMQAIGADSSYWDAHFDLMADIDLSAYMGTSFNIIGNYTTKFTGVFDGKGRKISNFTHSSSGTNYIGIFGFIDGGNAEITNLVLTDPNVDAGTGCRVGSLVGLLRFGVVIDCYVEGCSVRGNEDVGGLVGVNVWGEISNCHSAGNVSGDIRIGGLVGRDSESDISNCYSTGSVSGSGKIGGLVGVQDAGAISECYSTGTVVGTTSVGGLVGENAAVGWGQAGTMSNCYSTAKVTGNSNVGGLVGYNNRGGDILNCYSIGVVSGTTQVGGLVGYSSFGTTMNSFWNTETSGQSSSACGTGKTTEQMQTASTFIGWGCGSVWTIDDGNDYPRLWWESVPGEVITNPTYAVGSGTKADPYLIYTAEQLYTIGLIICDWDKHFKLMADVDLTGYKEMSPSVIGNTAKPFTGTFDGNGRRISNFTFKGEEASTIGLFGYVFGKDAEVKDLGLVVPNVHAAGAYAVGSLVGRLGLGTISNCYVEGGNVTGHGYIGGLVGDCFQGTILSCQFTGKVCGDSTVGGLVGSSNYGEVTNCYSQSEVSGSDDYIGGLVGYNNNGGTISSSYSWGKVTGGRRVGGLVGYSLNGGIIVDCYSSANTAGDGDQIGGLIGSNCNGLINRCYASGDVVGRGRVGGLAGSNDSKLSSSYSVGNVVATGSYVGGLVGGNSGRISNCYAMGSASGNDCVGGLVGNHSGGISMCYSVGNVSGTTDLGGLVGRDLYGVTTASFWDIEVSGQTLSAGGMGRTTTEMQNPCTFMAAGWDFVDKPDGPSDVWARPAGGGYPILWWQLSPLPALPKFSGGKGTAEKPYRISNSAELNSIGHNPRLMDAHFKLVNSVDLTGVEFFSIGSVEIPFRGVLNGKGFEVSNFTRNSAGADYVGLFGYVEGEKAQIKDLGLVNAKIDAGMGNYVGALVGWFANGSISRCYGEGGTVSGNDYVGGLVGYNWRGSITDSHSVGLVSGYSFVGGLVGSHHDCNWASGCSVREISGCYSLGDVQGWNCVGGLVGENFSGIIFDCYSHVNVSGGNGVGGLAGTNGYDSAISNSYSIGTVQGDDSAVGGLVGYNWDSYISRSYCSVQTTGVNHVGGLVGSHYGGTVTHCYSTGGVSGQQYVGGLVGLRSRGAVIDSFWDVNTSGLDTSAGGTPKTTAQMHMESTFTSAGWDFLTPIWIMCDEPDYPRLWWECPPLIEVEVEIMPQTLNLQSKGRWLTCYILLPEDCNAVQIEPNSVLLEEEIPADRLVLEGQAAMVKFSRSALQELLAELDTPAEVELLVSGELVDGTFFEGADTIRVIGKRGGKASK